MTHKFHYQIVILFLYLFYTCVKIKSVNHDYFSGLPLIMPFVIKSWLLGLKTSKMWSWQRVRKNCLGKYLLVFQRYSSPVPLGYYAKTLVVKFHSRYSKYFTYNLIQLWYWKMKVTVNKQIMYEIQHESILGMYISCT